MAAGPSGAEIADPVPAVSFVVIAHNEAPNIRRSLSSIVGQLDDHSCEVIVVDDGSTDGTAAVVTDFSVQHPEVRVLRFPENRGRGAARHAGAIEARGDFLAYVDADIVLPPDWLSRCLSHAEDADAVGGVAVPDGDLAYVYKRFGLEPKPVPHATEVTGSNGLYKRSLFDQVSFDPTLRDGEDVAINQALRASQARMLTLADLIVRHEESKTFEQSARWLYQSGLGAARQLYTYRRLRMPDLIFAGWVTVLVGAGANVRRRPKIAAGLPVAYLGSAAIAHVGRAFRWRRRGAHRLAGAVIIDMFMLATYFTGRIVGTFRPPRR
jgi:glycosyltransferase involved in cell wall biosynthesis